MSQQRSLRNWICRAGVCGALGVAFLSGAAYGASDKLDDAQAAMTKAILALKEAQSEAPQFEMHRKKAIDLVTRAQGEVVKAKTP